MSADRHRSLSRADRLQFRHMSDLPPPPPDPDPWYEPPSPGSSDNAYHRSPERRSPIAGETAVAGSGAPIAEEKPFEAQLVASIGFGCAVGSPVLFVMIWFGAPSYIFSVAALFGGLGFSIAGLVRYRRLTGRSRGLAVTGAAVSVIIFPMFLLWDYEIGRQVFSCKHSIFWGC